MPEVIVTGYSRTNPGEKDKYFAEWLGTRVTSRSLLKAIGILVMLHPEIFNVELRGHFCELDPDDYRRVEVAQ